MKRREQIEFWLWVAAGTYIAGSLMGDVPYAVRVAADAGKLDTRKKIFFGATIAASLMAGSRIVHGAR